MASSSRTDQEISAEINACNLRLKHVLLVINSTPAGDDYVARGCRIRIARELEQHGFVTTRTAGRLDWLICEVTPDGKRAVMAIARKLRVGVARG